MSTLVQEKLPFYPVGFRFKLISGITVEITGLAKPTTLFKKSVSVYLIKVIDIPNNLDTNSLTYTDNLSLGGEYKIVEKHLDYVLTLPVNANTYQNKQNQSANLPKSKRTKYNG